MKKLMNLKMVQNEPPAGQQTAVKKRQKALKREREDLVHFINIP